MLIDRLHASFDTGDFVGAVRLVDAITLAAEAMNHHPDLDIRWRTLVLGLSTHDAGGVTQLDIELAHRIHEIAAAHGAR
jgi:4a-hydroxytetrahydrobiopterin dehydratase